MKIYQLLFPDGDGYPAWPKASYLNMPSYELVNKCFDQPLSKDRYKQLINFEDVEVKTTETNSYGGYMHLEEFEVIEN